MRLVVVIVAAVGLLAGGCASGNFFCRGKGTLNVNAMMYSAVVTGDCGEGFEFSKGQKSLPLPASLAPAPAK